MVGWPLDNDRLTAEQQALRDVQIQRRVDDVGSACLSGVLFDMAKVRRGLGSAVFRYINLARAPEMLCVDQKWGMGCIENLVEIGGYLRRL